MIDGMVVKPYSVYGGLNEEGAALFDAQAGVFSDVDLALVSHRHHDHNQPSAACRFMQASTGTLLETSGEVIGLMREKCRPFILSSERVNEINPQYEAPVVLNAGAATVLVFPLSHGKRKYAKIQNYGHLVDLGGVRMLHVGDAAMDPADYEKAGLADIPLDVAFIPFWYFQPGPGAALVDRYMDATLKVAVHIPPGEMAEVQSYLAEKFPEVLVLSQPLAETRFIATPEP
jgi:L-ascorbate metabolism protein UlaG (beta-lactamase superfamily)